MEWEIKDAVIEKIYKSDTNKDGEPLITKKTKKPYTKVDIYFEGEVIDEIDYPGKVSMLDFDNVAADWEQGTRLTGKIVRKESDDGAYTFWNFELPRVNLTEEVVDLKARVTVLEEKLLGSKEEPVDIDDINF